MHIKLHNILFCSTHQVYSANIALWTWKNFEKKSSSANCARELFKGSNGLASLVDYTWKKFLGWGLQIFC